MRADQYQTFLADPDADGRSRAVYEYETAAASAPRSVFVPARSGGGSDVLVVALVIVGSLVVVGGGLMLWAHN